MRDTDIFAYLKNSRKRKKSSSSIFGTYIASVDDMLVKVDYDNGTLSLTRDGGLTFESTIDITGIHPIKYVHLFNDGRLLFCDHQKSYYTHDWQQYHESTVLNIDDTPFIPDQYDNFSCYKNSAEKMIVDGVEIICWGNYSTIPEVAYSDKVKVWYSADGGQTIKCCYQFNTEGFEECRHIHTVDFRKSDQTFWLQTGDEPGDLYCHWIKGSYDVTNDLWNWTTFATGEQFKTTNMVFYQDYVYYSWDIPHGGVVKAPIDTMNDPATHEQLLSTDKSCHYVIISPKGEIVAFQTRDSNPGSSREFYYAPDGINFTKIRGKMPSKFTNAWDAQYQTYWNINSNGRILAGIQARSLQEMVDWDRVPSAFVDDFVREAGFPNAFK